MTVPAAISVVTLGVRDVTASTRFYRALGFELSSASVEGEVSFFRTAGGILALWGESALAADALLTDEPPGFRGVSLAINVASREVVDTALDAARAAGADIPKPGTPTEWGGYTGYFTDPDGHLWEVTHNPGWPLDDRGLPVLP